MPTKVAGMGESLSGGQGARWQKEAPGTSSARHHDKKGFREREETSPSVPGWQEAIYKGPPCTGHPDKTASGDLGAVSRASRWEPAHGVRSVGRVRL